MNDLNYGDLIAYSIYMLMKQDMPKLIIIENEVLILNIAIIRIGFKLESNTHYFGRFDLSRDNILLDDLDNTKVVKAYSISDSIIDITEIKKVSLMHYEKC